jgi:hypothetical protein
VSRLIEKAMRRSRALDTEGLCIVAGEKVWSIRVDIHFLDHDGNLVDAACIAAITALLHFRRPDVTVVGEDVTIVSWFVLFLCGIRTTMACLSTGNNSSIGLIITLVCHSLLLFCFIAYTRAKEPCAAQHPSHPYLHHLCLLQQRVRFFFNSSQHRSIGA